MKIYNDGELDLDAATLELEQSSKLTNANQKAEAVARLSAAALLDIAGSLRALALESSLAVQYGGYEAPVMLGIDQPDDEEGDEVGTVAMSLPDIVDASKGTRVQLKTLDDDKGRHRTGTLDGVDGLDQGEPWVGVIWDDGPADVAKVYAANLEHYTGEASEPETERDDEAPDVPPISDAPEPTPDNFDDDFEAPDALALLEARQAKAAKKGKKK